MTQTDEIHPRLSLIGIMLNCIAAGVCAGIVCTLGLSLLVILLGLLA